MKLTARPGPASVCAKRRVRRLVSLPALLVFAFAGASLSALGQAPAQTSKHADEPFVIEKWVSHETVEADGSRTLEVEARIKIQSSAGLQEIGNLRVGYARDSGTMEYRYARARKPNGSVIETPVSAVLDVPAGLTQAAPMYSDQYIKHLNVQGLSVGDTLEYATRTHVRPMIPNTFSTEEDFIDDAVVLDGEYRLTVPTRLGVSVKSSVHQPVVTTAGALRTYTWRYDNPERLDPEEAALQAHANRNRRADVQATSFKDWVEVGSAVQRLWRDRVDHTQAVRDKARELTVGSQNDDEKIRAVFAFVALKIRYVAIAMGIGRIQPRLASEVLANGFGDCKDKHVLLAALLREVGIRAEPVLIAPGEVFDADVPSIGQFNHVVTLVPDVSGGLWMDATLEVAPPGLLARSELDQQALLVSSSGPATVVRTPTASLRATLMTTDVTGELDTNGTLTASVAESYAGDYELILRQTFRLLRSNWWKDAVQKLPLVERVGGEVSEVRVSDPEDTSSPLTVHYTLTTPKYANLGDLEISAALPRMGVPRLDKATLPPVPIRLGTTSSARATSRIKLPAGHTASLRSGSLPEVAVDNSFLTYRIRNTLQAGVFETDRAFAFKGKEIAVGDFPAYIEFFDTLGEHPSSIRLRSVKPWTWGDTATVEWYAGAGPAAVTTLQAAVAASNRAEFVAAFGMIEALVRRDPSSAAAAGVVLGWAQIRSGDRPLGLRTLGDLARTAPSSSGYKMLAMHLRTAGRAREAADAWAAGRAAFPDDGEFPLYLGEELLSQRRFEEAVQVLGAAVERESRSARLYWNLGKAQLGAKRAEDAVKAFRQAAESDTSSHALNEVAWAMAESGVGLEDARDFAENAVKDIEAKVAGLSLATLDPEGLRLMSSMAAYWDTLSLVLFKLGRLADAEAYQASAWDLMQEGQVALRLGDILEAKGDRSGAATYFARAALAVSPAASALTKLAAVEPSGQARAELLLRNSDALAIAWTVKVPAIPGVTGRAELFIRVGAKGAVEDVRFIRGDAPMRPASEMVRAASMPSRLPPGSAAHLVRRGTLTCDGTAQHCSLALARVGAVNSVN